MDVLFAAIGATAAALLEIGVVPYLSVGGAHPHPVLVLGVIWTIAVGIDSGVAWAFVGGLVLDILTGRPFGSSSIALLLAVGVSFVIARSLLRLRSVAPVIVTPFVSLGYSIVLVVLASGAKRAMDPTATGPLLLPGAAYDTVIAVLLGPLAVSLHDRRLSEERLEW